MELAIFFAAIAGLVFFIWRFQGASEALGKLELLTKGLTQENEKLRTVNNRKSRYVQILEETIVDKLSHDDVVNAFRQLQLTTSAEGSLPPRNGVSSKTSGD